MNKQIGNYMYSFELCRRHIGSTRYVIGFADAYNAYGLIGPEHNGIFILDDTLKAVVLDQHMPMASGYFGPDTARHVEIARIMGLSPRAFRAFIKAHPRTRDEYK